MPRYRKPPPFKPWTLVPGNTFALHREHVCKSCGGAVRFSVRHLSLADDMAAGLFLRRGERAVADRLMACYATLGITLGCARFRRVSYSKWDAVGDAAGLTMLDALGEEALARCKRQRSAK